MTDNISIRFAAADDAPLILGFIRALAEYEKLAHEVEASEQDIRDFLFSGKAYAECLLAFNAGAPLGFALFYHSYSTFLGKPGLYLEDLFVKPEARGRGVGKLLLQELARITMTRGLVRLEWWVLDWNKPAIRFYESLEAEAMDDWTVYRLSGQALENLAG